MRTEDHYHVDVLVGHELRYVRGPVLVLDEISTDSDRLYRIVDDNRTLGSKSSNTPSLPLAQALRQAASCLRQHLEPPIYPAWNTAPWELLGYSSPTTNLSLASALRPSRLRSTNKLWRAANRVGLDGLPADES